MTRTGIPYLDFTYNPCGFGCSQKCDGCWAKRLAPRVGKNIGCAKCAAFEPHFHPERLDEPLMRWKPAVIGVQFTGELFDRAHDRANIYRCIQVMQRADWHQYVILTQQPGYLVELALPASFLASDGIFWGVTGRNGAEAEEQIELLFSSGAKNCWISLEPLNGYVAVSPYMESWQPHLSGVIVGCDNRKSAPFKLEWIESVVEQCQAANVPVYVKQIRLKPGGKLLHDLADFPEHLRLRQLPWKLTTKGLER